jgi:hypothetical protein
LGYLVKEAAYQKGRCVYLKVRELTCPVSIGIVCHHDKHCRDLFVNTLRYSYYE